MKILTNWKARELVRMLVENYIIAADALYRVESKTPAEASKVVGALEKLSENLYDSAVALRGMKGIIEVNNALYDHKEQQKRHADEG